MAQNIVLKARQDGYNEAIQELRQKLLTKLEEMYMDPKVERGTPYAEAVLEVTRQIAAILEPK